MIDETCGSCGAAGQVAGAPCASCETRIPAPRDHTEVDRPGVAGVSDRGLHHHRNEDAMAVVESPAMVVAVVCDGVSSTVRPDDASQSAVDAASAVLAGGRAGGPDHVGAHRAAREAVVALDFEAQPGLGPPSCTYLAAVASPAEVHVAALGDCRAYLVDPTGTARQITVDDSWGTLQVQAGEMTPGEAYSDPRAHAITRWVARDADPSWVPTVTSVAAAGAVRLILASDGYWNYAGDDAAVTAHLAEAGSAPALEVARHLVGAAIAGGGADNITVVVVDLPGAMENGPVAGTDDGRRTIQLPVVNLGR